MLKPSQGGRQALCFPMTQPLDLDGGVLPTMIDESQVVDLAASCEHDQDKGPSQHKPEGEQGLPVPVLGWPSAEKAQSWPSEPDRQAV